MQRGFELGERVRAEASVEVFNLFNRQNVNGIDTVYASPRADSNQEVVGVTDPILPQIETSEEVRDRVLEAAEIIPVESLGTTDDCGFSPFADDTSTSRETAFAKVRSRAEGTRLASQILGA